MHRIRRLRATIVGLALLAAVLPTSQALAGWSYWNYSDGTDVDTNPNYAWTPYYRQRQITYSPYGIWFQKTDGPALQAQWIYCDGTYTGNVVGVSNSDPAPGVYLKANGSSPTSLTFCLAFRDVSGGGADSFTGSLNWDGPQI